MSTPTCDSIGYLWPNDFCLIVTVDKEIDDFDVDAAWIAGATFLGLFLGAGIVLLCAKPCIESWEKKKVGTKRSYLSSILIFDYISHF